MSDGTPDFVVYVTREYGEGKDAKTFWSRVGAAWYHKKGKGLNIQLDALPVDGKLVLLEPQAQEASDPKTEERGRGRR